MLFAFLLVVWFCVWSCLLRSAGVVGGSRRVAVVCPPLPVGGVPVPPSVVGGCCLCRARSGRVLSGAALSGRLARLRRLGVLV